MITIPDTSNAATYFVDRNVAEGRGASVAIECGDERVTYDQLLAGVNRIGNALRDELDVRTEERVLLLLLLDGPEFIYSFFGAIKIGAVPIPTSTLWKAADYTYVLNDSRARVLIASARLLPEIEAIAQTERPWLRHIVVVGDGAESARFRSFADLTKNVSPELTAEPTSKDAPAFWLYSSGSTGVPNPHYS